MSVINYNTWREQFVVSGSNFTGTTGTANRTCTLTYSPLYSVLSILYQGSPLTFGVDYTYSNQVVTFLILVDNGVLIEINYSTAITLPTLSGTSYSSAEYIQAEIRADTAFSSTTTPSLDTVNRWISEESRLIELKTGQVFANSAETSVYFDYDGSGIFRLPNSPIISIEELKYNENGLGTAASWLTLTEGNAYNFILYKDEGEIEFFAGESATNKITPKAGNKKLLISYTHGYAEVPYEIVKLCTLLVSKRVIMTLINSQSNSEGGNIQVGTISVTDPSNFSVNYIKSMNQEISDLWNTIGQNFNTFRFTRVYN